jgi:hypothetical protein
VGKKEEVHVCMEANTFGLSRDGEIPIEEEEGDGAGGGGKLGLWKSNGVGFRSVTSLQDTHF